MKMKVRIVLSTQVGRETGLQETDSCCLSLETVWCQEKPHDSSLQREGCLFFSREVHLGKLITYKYICSGRVAEASRPL